MKVITGGRRAGKTTKLIKLAAEDFAYIVCCSKEECQRIFEQAKEMGLYIPFPITIQDLLEKRYYGEGVRRIAVDNIGFVFSQIAPDLQTIAITVDGNEDGVEGFIGNWQIPEGKVSVKRVD